MCLPVVLFTHSPHPSRAQYILYTFKELLPHHILYVQKAFRGFDHFYETRADNGLLDFVQSYDKRAALPHQQTCEQILQVTLAPPPYP